MNDGNDIIIVRNDPFHSDAFGDIPNNSGDIEKLKRRRQAEYAEELRQQILHKKALEDQKNNPQHRVFMSNLGSLYGDQSFEIERKRKQQEKLAESLRQQIEEKRRAREIEKQKEAAQEAAYYSNSNSNKIQFTQDSSSFEPDYSNNDNNFSNNATMNNNNNSRFINQTRQTHYQTQPIPRKPFVIPFQNTNENETKKITKFSETTPLAALPHLTFEVPTESPFSHSTVQTPPLGFSLRRDYQSSLSITAPIHQNNPPLTIKDNFSKSSLSSHPTNLRQSQPARILNNKYIPKSNFNNSTINYDQFNLRSNNNGSSMRLGTASELVYPDGHISPINSPH